MQELVNQKSHLYSINSKDSNASLNFYHYFDLCFSNSCPENIENIVLLCIGSDRSTGDCLGPLVGHKLHKNKYSNIHIIGSLENPTHAKNLEEKIAIINKEISKPFIIALDACLGKYNTVGYIHIAPGPLKPGAGVNKLLPWVGDMHIKGIVNTGGFMEHTILQNTRLHLVMKLTEIIATGLQRHFLLINKVISLNAWSEYRGHKALLSNITSDPYCSKGT